MKLPNIFEKESTPVKYAAGSVIYEEGQPRNSMYIVKKGEVDLLVRGALVETVAEGGFFGEIAMVDHSPRSATAMAKTDCSLIALNEKQFLFNVQEAPFFSIIVMRSLTNRLRKRSMVFAPSRANAEPETRSRILRSGAETMSPLDLWAPEITEDIRKIASDRILDGGNLATREDLPKRTIKLALMLVRSMNPLEQLAQDEEATLKGAHAKTLRKLKSEGLVNSAHRRIISRAKGEKSTS